MHTDLGASDAGHRLGHHKLRWSLVRLGVDVHCLTYAEMPAIKTTSHAHPPLLSAMQERTLAKRIKAGDQHAQEELVLANRKLIFRIVRGYRTSGVSEDDLIQEGSVGLIRAAQNFNPRTHRIRFSTYAAFWIRAFIQRALSDNGSLVRTEEDEDRHVDPQSAENDLLKNEERAVVRAALRRLSPFEDLGGL